MNRGALALALTLAAAAATAHPLGFGLLTLDERDGGEVEVTLRVSGTEQQGNAMTVPAPPGCALLGDEVTERSAETWATRARWRCGGGVRGRPVSLRGLEGSGVQVIARATLRDGSVREATFDDARRTLTLQPSMGRAWTRYLALGARHIAEGADHLALLLCLALWVRGARALLATVTGFTLGHSVTLALAGLGGLRLPQRPVEACIALSVLLLAVELAHRRPPPARRAPLSVGVGLLHGMGFAGALRDVGLPPGARLPALLAFNAGVELGQLGFLVVLFALERLVRRSVGEAPRARRALIEALGAWSAMLLLQRVAA